MPMNRQRALWTSTALLASALCLAPGAQAQVPRLPLASIVAPATSSQARLNLLRLRRPPAPKAAPANGPRMLLMDVANAATSVDLQDLKKGPIERFSFWTTVRTASGVAEHGVTFSASKSVEPAVVRTLERCMQLVMMSRGKTLTLDVGFAKPYARDTWTHIDLARSSLEWLNCNPM
jgi:hypothetical protein